MVAIYTKSQNAPCPPPTKRDLEQRDPQLAPAGFGSCSWKQVNFEAPYGIEALDGTKWGGLKKDDIAFNVSFWSYSGQPRICSVALNLQGLYADIRNNRPSIHGREMAMRMSTLR